MKLEPLTAVSQAFHPRIQTREEQARSKLLLEIRQVVADLDTAHAYFCELTDPDLIDAQIYLMKSLESRYQFLIRRAKEYGLQNSAFSSEIII